MRWRGYFASMLPADFRWHTAIPYETDERALMLGTVEVARYTQKVDGTGWNVMVDRQRAEGRSYATAPERDTARRWIEQWAVRDRERIVAEVADYNAGLAGWARR